MKRLVDHHPRGPGHPFLAEHARPLSGITVHPGPVPRERLRSIGDAIRQRVEMQGRPVTLRHAHRLGVPPYAL